MKSILLSAAAAVAAAFSAAAVQSDGIAAVVGGKTILRSDVEGELRRIGADQSRFDEVRDRLVERLLILKAAADSKMTMQEWVVDNRVREIVDDMFGGDRSRLDEALIRQKVQFSEWRERIKEDTIVGAMRWNVVDKNVTASPAEMKAEFTAHPERYRKDGRVTVSVILLRPEDAAKKDAISAALKEGGDFAALAKEHSADTHAKDGGVWRDVVPAEVFRPEIAAAIEKTAKGGLSGWLDVDGWSFFVRKDDSVDSAPQSFAEAYTAVEANVKNANAKKLYDEWMKRLRADAYIKIY